MRKYRSIFWVVICTLLLACDDVFEEDITEDRIVLVNPENEANISGNTVQFDWVAIEGADSYRIQVLDNQQIIVLDSIVTVPSLSQQIEGGVYNWRVRGENFAYITAYSELSSFSLSGTMVGN